MWKSMKKDGSWYIINVFMGCRLYINYLFGSLKLNTPMSSKSRGKEKEMDSGAYVLWEKKSLVPWESGEKYGHSSQKNMRGYSFQHPISRDYTPYLNKDHLCTFQTVMDIKFKTAKIRKNNLGAKITLPRTILH